jgi:hypothetical protein
MVNIAVTASAGARTAVKAQVNAGKCLVAVTPCTVTRRGRFTVVRAIAQQFLDTDAKALDRLIQLLI